MRKHWKLPLESELRKDIDDFHQNSTENQLKRYKFLWQEFGPPTDMLLIGGVPAMFALNELKLSFIKGNFLACVLLAQTFIEQSLGGSFIIAGQDRIAESGFYQLIENARYDDFISEDLAKSLHQLRLMRNPYVHPQAGIGPRTYMQRLLNEFTTSDNGITPEDLAQKDAETAIKIVVDFLRESSRSSGHPWEPPPKQLELPFRE